MVRLVVVLIVLTVIGILLINAKRKVRSVVLRELLQAGLVLLAVIIIVTLIALIFTGI